MAFKEGMPKKSHPVQEASPLGVDQYDHHGDPKVPLTKGYNPIKPIGEDGIVERKAGGFVVLVVGDIISGFRLIGPFLDQRVAQTWSIDNYVFAAGVMPIAVPNEWLAQRVKEREEDKAAGY